MVLLRSALARCVCRPSHAGLSARALVSHSDSTLRTLASQSNLSRHMPWSMPPRVRQQRKHGMSMAALAPAGGANGASLLRRAAVACEASPSVPVRSKQGKGKGVGAPSPLGTPHTAQSCARPTHRPTHGPALVSTARVTRRRRPWAAAVATSGASDRRAGCCGRWRASARRQSLTRRR